jgi:hypothetical protein
VAPKRPYHQARMEPTIRQPGQMGSLPSTVQSLPPPHPPCSTLHDPRPSFGARPGTPEWKQCSGGTPSSAHRATLSTLHVPNMVSRHDAPLTVPHTPLRMNTPQPTRRTALFTVYFLLPTLPFRYPTWSNQTRCKSQAALATPRSALRSPHAATLPSRQPGNDGTNTRQA